MPESVGRPVDGIVEKVAEQIGRALDDFTPLAGPDDDYCVAARNALAALSVADLEALLAERRGGSGSEAEEEGQRAFIIFRQDEPGNHEGTPVAVYVGDNEACKRHLDNAQAVNPDSRYYVLDKKLNPQSDVRLAPVAELEEAREALAWIADSELDANQLASVAREALASSSSAGGDRPRGDGND